MVVQQQKGTSSAVRYHELQAIAIDAVALFRDLVTVLPNSPVFINLLCFFPSYAPRLPCMFESDASMWRREIEIWSAATQVPQHVKKFQMTSSTGPSITPEISSKNTHINANDCLDVLSNELLFMVAEHLLDEVQDRFEDDELPPTTSPGCRDGPPFSNEFEIDIWDSKAVFAQDPSAASVIALKNLASTSRRFRAIAQPALFRAPVLSIGRSCQWSQMSPIYLFARAMLEYPHLRKWVTRLRIDMPSCWGDSMASPIGEPLGVCRMAVAFIDTQKWMNHDARLGWKWQLQHLRAGPFCGVILCLLPSLTELSILKGADSDDDVFLTLFWSSYITLKNARKMKYALRSLMKCPGLLHLRRFRTDSIASISKSPLRDITTLASLHLTPTIFLPPKHIDSLDRIKTLRLACNVWHLPQQPRFPVVPPPSLPPHVTVISLPPSHFPGVFSVLLTSLPSLQTLELYASADILYEHNQNLSTSRALGESQRYMSLVHQCEIAASTLKSLELPRGWWTLPNIDPSIPSHIDTCNAAQSNPLDQADPFENKQLGAYTGSITDFSPLICLETLIIHSTAIIAKGSYDTEVADPTLTLPPSIKNITVYGAHDELWSWIGDILDHRGAHFPHLSTITLLREEPVPGLDLSRLCELKSSHKDVLRKDSK
jgi:hypothetical protein